MGLGLNWLNQTSPASPNREIKENLEIFGSKGAIHITPLERPSLKVYSRDSGLPEALGSWFSPRLEWVPFEERGVSLHFNADEDPWTGEHKHFVECIRDGKPVVTDGEFGRKVLEVVQAGYQAMREGRRITLPLSS